MTSGDLQVMMVNPAGQKKGLITYTSCMLVQRHLAVGTWEVRCPLNATTVQAAAPGWRLLITGPGITGGGYVEEPELRVGESQSGAAGRSVPELVLRGVDDMVVLADRLAYPVPGSAADSQAAAAYDTRTGQASTIIHQFINLNAGPGALVARRVPGMTMATDPATGGSTSAQARFTNLLELVAKVAEPAGLSVRVVPTSTTAREVRIAAVQDLTGPARFSVRLNNLKSVVYRRTAPSATYVVGGGRGEEEARTFVVREDAAASTAWRRREGFYDYRSADASGELERGTEKALAESAEKEELALVPADSPVLQYGTHYGLGARVTVEVWPGIVVDQVIREVEITQERGHWIRVQPKVGTPEAGMLRSSRTVAALGRRLAQLETGV